MGSGTVKLKPISTHGEMVFVNDLLLCSDCLHFSSNLKAKKTRRNENKTLTQSSRKQNGNVLHCGC